MDVGLVAGAFVLAHVVADRLGLPGPGSWAVLCALAVASWRLSAAGLRWGDLGLRLPKSSAGALAWVAVLYVATALLVVLAVNPLAAAAGWPALTLSRFAELPGNAALLAGYLALAWVSAAIAEELVFRGFLLTRLEALAGTGLAATVLAVAGQALLFGAGHWYLGMRGVTIAALAGLVYGTVYACNGRNLVPLVVAHGVTDSLSLIAIYSGIARIA